MRTAERGWGGAPSNGISTTVYFSHFFSLSPALQDFSIFDPTGHSSSCLASIPLAAMDIIFLLGLALMESLSLLLISKISLPYLLPTLKPPGLDWSLERVQGKVLQPEAAVLLLLALAGEAAGCLPREMCVGKAQQVAQLPLPQV